MIIEILKIDEVIPYENNARTHDDAQIQKLCKLITEFGFKVPVIVDENNVLLSGHGRLLAAKALDMEEIPATRETNFSEEKKRAFRIADNFVSELSKWDFGLVACELEELSASAYDLVGVGLDDLKNMAASAVIASAEGGSEPTNQDLSRKYVIEIQCIDESEQETFYKQLKAEGYECSKC